MKTVTTNTEPNEPVFIADECGDTLWDEVLQQNINVCAINTDSTDKNALQQNESSDLVADNIKKYTPWQDHSEPSLLQMQ